MEHLLKEICSWRIVDPTSTEEKHVQCPGGGEMRSLPFGWENPAREMKEMEWVHEVWEGCWGLHYSPCFLTGCRTASCCRAQARPSAQAAHCSVCTCTEKGFHCMALLTCSFCCFSFSEPWPCSDQKYCWPLLEAGGLRCSWAQSSASASPGSFLPPTVLPRKPVGQYPNCIIQNLYYWIMGSFVPRLYYSYCSPQPQLIYFSIICVQGMATSVAQWNWFASPKHQQARAETFQNLGLRGLVPNIHFTLDKGCVKETPVDQMGWLFFMVQRYITGASLYAEVLSASFLERLTNGSICNGFFHILEVAAAFILQVLAERDSVFNIRKTWKWATVQMLRVFNQGHHPQITRVLLRNKSSSSFKSNLAKTVLS